MQTILNYNHGCIKPGVNPPGEMLLVLGRPWSGCKTLPKMLSNTRDACHD